MLGLVFITLSFVSGIILCFCIHPALGFAVLFYALYRTWVLIFKIRVSTSQAEKSKDYPPQLKKILLERPITLKDLTDVEKEIVDAERLAAFINNDKRTESEEKRRRQEDPERFKPPSERKKSKE